MGLGGNEDIGGNPAGYLVNIAAGPKIQIVLILKYSYRQDKH